jgi:CheY-like chemotaxis protein
MRVRVRVIHWREEEAGPLVEACRAAGFQVDYDPVSVTAQFRFIKQTMPDVVAIDLSRMPSHGREVGRALRRMKYSRHIPIVYVGGEAEKVEAIRKLLPDVTFTVLKRVAAAIRTAAKRHTANPVVPPDFMERYSSRTTAQKLGIREKMTVAVHQPPRDYVSLLGELPADTELIEDPEDAHPITLWFVRDPREYREALPEIRRLAARSKLWILWHKASADGKMTDRIVREWANEMGLVDYKICAVDQRWSGMLFAVKKK